MHKAFGKMLGDIKKQKQRQQKKEAQKEETAQQPSQDPQMSSDEEEKLKAMGVHKKKIQKEAPQPDNKWKNDKFKATIDTTPRPPSQLRPPMMVFEDSPGYTKIMQVVKSLKIYIRQVDEHKIIFNEIHAFNSAKKLFAENGITFKVTSESKTTQ